MPALALQCASTKVCNSDSDCKGVNPAGFWKAKDDGTVECETVDSTCCNKFCVDPRVTTCNDLGTRCQASGSDVTCTKNPLYCTKYQRGCADGCYNPSIATCSSYKTVNDQQIQFTSSQEHMNSVEGFFIVAIPLLFLLATIIAVVLALMAVMPAMGSLQLPGKVVVLCALLSVLFGLFFYFNAAWTYGVVITTTTVITLITIANGTGKGPLPYFCLFVQGIVFLYLLGPFPDKNFLLSYGNGVLNAVGGCSGNYGNYFTKDSARYSPWTTDNPNNSNWGYCSTGFLVWERICAVFCIILSGFGWVIHLYTALGSSADKV
eukprot:TRINITY_DN55196_c0_g1_i1.p1 TRINITY_DN55196_c0_g1~~TRINITY_DN55196_c0_g1_i1.p1  ORF type:complete len:343 (+),score=59.26 TRINITY_DN55196_c0_g1_i1:71-1030(+)